MRLIKHFSIWTVCAVLGIGLSACSDKEKDEPTTLSVSPTQITLLSDQNSTATINVSANKAWNLTTDASWLSLSATSGNGNTSIVVTALEENASASTREANITVTSEDQTATVSISQLGAYVSDCNVEFEDVVLMTTSVAFHFEVGSKVSYFNFGWLKSSAAGWTEDKIIGFLTDENSVNVGADDAGSIWGLDGMKPDTEYYLVAIAFDAKGKRGELTKERIKTPKESNLEPLVPIADVRASSSKWQWTTYPDGRVQRYYMISLDGGSDVSLIPYINSEAEIAAVMKQAIDAGNLSPMSNSIQTWTMNRDADATSLFIATWGLDVDGKYANALSYGSWSISSNSPKRNTLPESKEQIQITRMGAETVTTLLPNISILND